MKQHQASVLIISAPSGSGKTTLTRALQERFDCFAFSVSATTRPPRPHEQHGVHYFFLNAEEFARYREAGRFLEWEEVYPGRLYGTLRSEVDRMLAAGQVPMFDVDVKGGLRLKETFGVGALAVFIRPPSLEVLRERLLRRASDSPEDIERRLAKASEEMAYEGRFDHVIVNDVLPEAVEALCALVSAHLGVQPVKSL
jgi:guanylate kinase